MTPHPPHHAEDHGHDHGEEHHHGHVRSRRWWQRLLHPHNHSADLDVALESSRDGVRALRASLFVLGLTAVVQAVVVVFSGSVALLGDTLHNFADALTAVPLWFAFRLSRRPPNERFTYGYGRTEDLAGVVVVLVIAASAGLAAYEAIDRLINPRSVDYLSVVAVAGVVGFLGNELAAQIRIRTGRRIGSAALVADGLHARTDGLTSLAVVAGVIGVALGFANADPIAGLIIAAAILLVCRDAARLVLRRLLDAVDPKLFRHVNQTIAETPGVQTVDRLALRWVGHRLHVEAEITVEPETSLASAHEFSHNVEHRLLHSLPSVERVIVHASPAATRDTDPHALLAHHTDGTAHHHHDLEDRR